MKLTTETRSVTRSGPFREKRFTINASAKAFDILSSKIYTDVPLAIVRELSTNAYDAHVDAGNVDRPFRVHLPNALEPFFAIRDYGTGLSPEDVENVYTSYFSSTRDESNDHVGALGLGSKSPFAYTDQFTVISYLNGMKYTYSLFKGEDSCPTIAALGETETEEPNGLEIYMSVKTDNFRDFERAAKRVYRFFNVKPEIIGNTIYFTDFQPSFSGTDFDFYDHNSDLYSQVSVVMGQICYDVPRDVIASTLRHKLAYNGRLVLHANLGDCSITPSREELHCDEKTVMLIQRKLDIAMTEINAYIQSAIDNEDIMVNRMRKLRDYQNIFSFEYDKFMIAGQTDAYEAFRAYVSTRNQRLQINSHAHSRIDAGHELVFIENDIGELSQKYRNHIRYWILQQRDRDNKYIFLITINNRVETERVFGEIKLKVSELPAPPRASIQRNPGSFIKRMIIGCENLAKSWEGATKIESENACVVIRKGNMAVVNDQEMRPDAMRAMLAALGIKHVYGVAACRLEKTQEEYDLDLLDDVAKNYITKQYATWTPIMIARHVSHRNNLQKDVAAAIRNLSEICRNYVDLCTVDDIISYGEASLATLFGFDMNPTVNYAEDFFARYPLLKHIDMAYSWNLSSKASPEQIADYIKLVDKNND